MDLKLQDAKISSHVSGSDRPASRLRKEMSMNDSQYRKTLELMLDLEKKTD